MKKYSIVKNNNIVYGPLDWNQSSFQDFLFENGLSISLPLVGSDTIMIFGFYSIWPTEIVSKTPKINEKITGTVIQFDSDIVYVTDVISKLSNDECTIKLKEMKSSLIKEVNTYKKTMISSGLLINPSGTPYIFDVDEISLGSLSRALTLFNDSCITIKWKLKDGTWASFNYSEINYVLNKGISYIQECYNKELIIQEKIQQLTLNNISSFDIKNEWSK